MEKWAEGDFICGTGHLILVMSLGKLVSKQRCEAVALKLYIVTLFIISDVSLNLF